MSRLGGKGSATVGVHDFRHTPIGLASQDLAHFYGYCARVSNGNPPHSRHHAARTVF